VGITNRTNMEDDMTPNELTAPLAVLQSQIRAAHALKTKKLRTGPLRGLEAHEFPSALIDAVESGLVKFSGSGKLSVTTKGLSLLRHS